MNCEITKPRLKKGVNGDAPLAPTVADRLQPLAASSRSCGEPATTGITR